MKAGYEWQPRRSGRPPGRGDKLDREALCRAVEEQPDLMLNELAMCFGVSSNTGHHACKNLQLSRKKTAVYAEAKHYEHERREIAEYIEVFYHRQRRHFRLGNCSPAAFTQQWARQQSAA